jgi:hypothetical protein
VTIEELQQIESEEAVAFSLSETGRIAAKGPEAAVDRALVRIASFRDEVAALLRKRQGLPEPGEAIVVREVSSSVPSLEVQKENYRRWFTVRGSYYTPSEEQLSRMWSALEADDEVIFDFAHSITVRKRNGLLIAINRKGEITQPSPYSPAVQAAKGS